MTNLLTIASVLAALAAGATVHLFVSDHDSGDAICANDRNGVQTCRSNYAVDGAATATGSTCDLSDPAMACQVQVYSAGNNSITVTSTGVACTGNATLDGGVQCSPIQGAPPTHLDCSGARCVWAD